MPSELLKRRLIFVTGKGGVGKTTIALALGLGAARIGLRTVVIDLNGADPDHSHACSHADEHELWDGVYRVSVDPRSAMEEYLTVKIGGAPGRLLGHSHLFNAFAMATPGMRELLSLGKVWELAQDRRRTPGAEPYDLAIVDAPASGHGAALLRTPRTFAEIAKVGPIAHQAEVIAQTLADRSFTAYVAVTTPEEMPVTETLELHEALQRERLELDRVVLNAVHPDRFDEADLAALSPLAQAPPVPLALSAHRLALAERDQAARLEERFGDRLHSLPFLYAPELARAELEQLAEELEL